MQLTRLHIHRVRNLKEVICTPHPRFNLFLGKNGTGKTSLLEAIYLLALGRSFRSRQIQTIISHEAQTLACFGEIMAEDQLKTPLGIEKNRQGEVKCKVAGEICARLSVFATTLPVQLITPESFKLLLEGPQERRRFLDWGVFYLDPTFAQACQRYQRLLKQRNAALKQRKAEMLLSVWDKELASLGEQITQARQTYLAALQPFMAKTIQQLLPSLAITLTYQQGWSSEDTLEDALVRAHRNDQRLGHTSVGPHRAELGLYNHHHPVDEVLSRGQQKLLICALQLAQGQHLYHAKGKKCLYLIDDLSSELDGDNRLLLLTQLAATGHQVFMTGADAASWQIVQQQFEHFMFHVEHGAITQANAACEMA